MKKQRAAIAAVYLVGLAVIGIATWIAKPSVFGGASKRAADSTTATAKLETATNAQGSAAAASVVKIGEANATAPDSPSKNFISAEVPVALSRLPAPDAAAILDAERRRAAVMEGRADEARRLYEQAAKRSEALQHERDEALAARRNADAALEIAAAAEHARTVQALGAGVVAILALAAFAWLKLNHVGPDTLGKIAAEIHAGGSPIAALDRYIDARHHDKINLAARVALPLTERNKAAEKP